MIILLMEKVNRMERTEKYKTLSCMYEKNCISKDIACHTCENYMLDDYMLNNYYRPKSPPINLETNYPYFNEDGKLWVNNVY